MKALIRLYASQENRRGLGDCVHSIIVLNHFKRYYPEWKIYTETDFGKEGCFFELVEHTYNFRESPAKLEDFDRVINLYSGEPTERNHELCVKYQLPATKSLLAIVDDLKLEPIKDLFYYNIKTPEETKNIIRSYFKTFPVNKGVVTIHYRAQSWKIKKNIDQKHIVQVCNFLVRKGYTPLILDWNNTPFVDQSKIFSPKKENPIWLGKPHENASIITAIIELSQLFIGVDSGPLHLAGGTKTPTIGFWKRHHPISFFDLSKNVLHLVPHNHLDYLGSPYKNELNEVFQKNYNYELYNGNASDAIVMGITNYLINKNAQQST